MTHFMTRMYPAYMTTRIKLSHLMEKQKTTKSSRYRPTVEIAGAELSNLPNNFLVIDEL